MTNTDLALHFILAIVWTLLVYVLAHWIKRMDDDD